jgi:hypothetical protein
MSLRSASLPLTLLLVALMTPARATGTVTYADIQAGLPGLECRSAAWADYDADGDLDFVLSGDVFDWGTGDLSPQTLLYRNDGDGVFTGIDTGWPEVAGQVAWGDYDNDGDLDLLLMGDGNVAGRLCRIYRNDGNDTFTDIQAGLPGRLAYSAAWGDYDNDGDLDLLVSGLAYTAPIVSVYRNDGGVFTDTGASLTGHERGRALWGDLDRDGDLDILVTGEAPHIYRNDAGVFTATATNLPAAPVAALGDYDNDGDPDVLMIGATSGVYRNDGGGTFTDIGVGLPGLFGSSAAWGDYDNDGDLDFMFTGYPNSSPDQGWTAIGRNDGGGVFTEALTGLPGCAGAAVWGDYDNDGDLDILLAGSDFGLWPDPGCYVTGVFRSDGASPNVPPAAPGDLAPVALGDRVRLTWTAAADPQTPASGLSYNLRISSTPGGVEIASPMADLASGYRRVVQPGNAQERTSWTLKAPALGETIYWSVQAVDGAFAGSPFTTERRYTRYFTPLDPGLRGAWLAALAWGDYDNDGDLDLVIAGTDSSATTIIHRNDGAGVFTDIGAGLPGVTYGAVAWGDYDGDGDLDLAISGSGASGRISRIYRNDGASVFTDVGAGLPGVMDGALAWGDCDNDGDLDLVLAGNGGSGSSPVLITRIYRNDGSGVFTDAGATLPDVRYATAAWGDYDNDGDLDLLIAGRTDTSRITRIYRNDGAGAFTDIHAGLLGASRGSAAWGDYDNDGDLDLLLAGAANSSAYFTRVYRNDGAGVFTDLAAGLPDSYRGSVAWGDYDNDGRLDILLTGDTGFMDLARVYHNDGDGSFTDLCTGLQGLLGGGAAWGDFDSDGDLDAVVTGLSTVSEPWTPSSRLYRNDVAPANTPPSAPDGLTAQVVGDSVTFHWNPATDAQTPASGLTYNLRVGTSPRGNEVLAAQAASTDGRRRLAQVGNVQHRTSWTLVLPPGPYYWSVQAVDGAFAGSSFAAERDLNSTLDVAPEVPKELSFALAGSNPVMGGARFRFGLPARTRVELTVYDVTGRRVADVVDGDLPAGYHTAEWPGRRVPGPGIFFARLTAGGHTLTARLVVLK